MQWVYTTMNVTGSVNDRCEGHYVPLGEQGWRCLFSPDMLPFIATPRVFVANFIGAPAPGGCNATQFAALANLRTVMIEMLRRYVLEDPRRGAFLAECSDHVIEDDSGAFSAILVQNQTFSQTFAAWYSGVAERPGLAAPPRGGGRRVGD